METWNLVCVMACVAIGVSCGRPTAAEGTTSAAAPQGSPEPATTVQSAEGSDDTAAHDTATHDTAAQDAPAHDTPAEAAPVASPPETAATATARRPTRDAFASGCHVSPAQAYDDSLGIDGEALTLDADTRGGLLAWRSAAAEVRVVPIGPDGVVTAEPVVHTVGARRGQLALQRVGDLFVLAASGRCDGGHQCIHAFALDAAGARIGEPVEQRLRLAADRELRPVELHERDPARLWSWRRGGSGSRDSWIEAFAIDVTETGARIEATDVGMYAVDRSGLSGETNLTTAHLFDAQTRKLHALTGWAAARMDGGELRGRSLYLGAARSEVRGLGGRVRDFVVVSERAHLLLQEGSGALLHVVLSAVNDDYAVVEEQSPVEADALPEPFAQRAFVRIERGSLHVRDALGRPVTEPVDVGAVTASAFTGDRLLLVRRSRGATELRSVTCGG